ncbi:MAG TPA: glycerophosphodiester phosphodiesterase, partial [Leuconostoc lactis]|nr:glycerophosphodiester phosphodiesterase [Leuconostoc lactis]
MTKQTQIIAHRGYRAVAPENTLPAFEAALAYDIDMLEMDLHR